MTGIRFKDGVLPIGTLAPAGVRILAALDTVARRFSHDLVITCADKAHAPSDPHSTGEAFDVRTHDLDAATKAGVFHELMIELAITPIGDTPRPVPGIGLQNLATSHFYAQIEDPGGPNEHCHVQRRQNTVYA